MSQINDPNSWYEIAEKKTSVECRGVQFTFRASGGGTNPTMGPQFPIFFCQRKFSFMKEFLVMYIGFHVKAEHSTLFSLICAYTFLN